MIHPGRRLGEWWSGVPRIVHVVPPRTRRIPAPRFNCLQYCSCQAQWQPSSGQTFTGDAVPVTIEEVTIPHQPTRSPEEALGLLLSGEVAAVPVGAVGVVPQSSRRWAGPLPGLGPLRCSRRREA